MKNILKSITNKMGYTLISNYHYSNLFDIRQISQLDCSYIFNKVYSKNQELTIFDVGANEGQTALKFHKYFPNSTIYSFEPIKETFEILRKQTNLIHKIHPFLLALGANIGKERVAIQQNNQWNSLLPKISEIGKQNNLNFETVEINTIDNFMLMHKIDHIDILKSDTEGFEFSVLEGAKEAISNNKIDYIYIEVGYLKENIEHVYWLDMIEFLSKNKFKYLGSFEIERKNKIIPSYGNSLFVNQNYLEQYKQI